MNIEELFSKSNSSDIITELKKKAIYIPSWGVLQKEYEPKFHKIVNDDSSRKDKVRTDGTTDKAARIYLGLEKLLTKRINEFTFAIPVKRIYSNIDDNEVRQSIADAIESIYKNARIDTINIKRGLAYYASCEFFTYWYVQKSPNSLYGFDSDWKLKCRTYSPMDGVSLYPLFDEYDDMIAMSFEYSKQITSDKSVTYFETFTESKHRRWKMEDGDSKWTEVLSDDEVIIGKIPAVYSYRQAPVYDGLSHLREELEYTLSRNSDVIAYNSAPILKVSGDIKGEETKGETRRVYRVENGGDVSYVSWGQSIEALKYQVEELLKLYFMQAQMPDISAERMMSLGSIGFDARQTILMDAHLRIGDESGAWIETFERECNVIKAFLKQIKPEWESEIDNVDVEHIITPFVQFDETSTVNRIMAMNGGKPLISHVDSIRMAGYSSDPDKTKDEIDKDNQQTALGALMNDVMSEQGV